MKLYFTDHDYKIGSMSFPDIPFLVSETGYPVRPANNYLRYIAMVRGRTRSPQTWRNYANHLYDYFAFLEANKLLWDDETSDPHPLIQWRNWGIGRRDEAGYKQVSPETINLRLTTVCRFYEWAPSDGWLEQMPFRVDVARVPGLQNKSMLSHLNKNLESKVYDVTLRV